MSGHRETHQSTFSEGKGGGPKRAQEPLSREEMADRKCGHCRGAGGGRLVPWFKAAFPLHAKVLNEARGWKGSPTAGMDLWWELGLQAAQRSEVLAASRGPHCRAGGSNWGRGGGERPRAESKDV